MEKRNIYLHGSYIGTGGYNNHTRDLCRHLDKISNIKVRNFTVGSKWKGNVFNQHDDEPYINDVDKKILYKQILWNNDKTLSDFIIYPDERKNFNHDVNIVLCETNHYIFYDKYIGPKIAYNAWETTLQPINFFNKLLEYDELWVPSEWQKECTIKQGYPKDKIRVLPEGVDTDLFFPEDVSHNLTSDGRFKFFLAGRWDYRKSTKEIIESFLSTFTEDEPVDLIVSIDNPNPVDGMKSTKERLEYFNLTDERIKVVSFLTRDDYISLLKSCDVFLSCSRSEGWNLPLLESMCCGTPSIYSNCSGQLEFAKGKGIPVDIIGEKPSNLGTYNHYNENIGNYYEPDFNDLKVKMRLVYDNYTDYKTKSIKESEELINNYNWDKIASITLDYVNEFLDNYTPNLPEDRINVTYLDGPKVEIIGENNNTYNIKFMSDDKILYETNINSGMWASCSIKYYVKWKILINDVLYEELDLNNKNVLISMESKSWGDTISWVPYVVEFSKKNNCTVFLSTFHNEWFKGIKEYENIKFINPGESINCYAVYRIGWFKNENGLWDGFHKTPIMPNLIPLQRTATEILGLEFKELNYGVKFKDLGKYIKGKYVVIGTQSTAGCKEWTYDNWVELSLRLNKMGYKVITSTKDKYFMPNTINDATDSFDKICTLLKHSEFFIGLSSGLSWLNWSLGKKTVMIAGFTEDNHEFTKNNYRVKPNNPCIRCWNDSEFTFDAGDWDWCPVYKGTKKQHICQKSITVDNVIKTIEKII